jgi:hypothetical protein
VLFLLVNINRRDLKGGCKKMLRGSIFPRHSSARRRTSPVSRTIEKAPKRVLFCCKLWKSGH